MTRVKSTDIDELLLTLQANPSDANRNAVVERSIPLAAKVASDVRAAYHLDRHYHEDLLQCALLVLTRRVTAYEPARGRYVNWACRLMHQELVHEVVRRILPQAHAKPFSTLPAVRLPEEPIVGRVFSDEPDPVAICRRLLRASPLEHVIFEQHLLGGRRLCEIARNVSRSPARIGQVRRGLLRYLSRHLPCHGVEVPHI